MTPGKSSQSDLVDMEKMVNSITREIDLYWSAVESDEGNKLCSIHKVPQHILEVDRNAYEPIILSIGSYHHGAPKLTAMEREKWKCLDFILKLNCELSLQDYIRAIHKLEKQARCYYSEEIPMEKMMFVRLLLLDSCFILVKVDRTVVAAMQLKEVPTDVTPGSIAVKDGLNSGQEVESNCPMQRRETEIAVHEIELTKSHFDHIESKSNRTEHEQNADYASGCNNSGDWYANYAWHDLFLLENQMPFFIVEAVYNLALSKQRAKAFLRDKIVECVEDILRQFPKGIEESKKPKNFYHLLHLCHIYLRPTHKCVGTNQNHSKRYVGSNQKENEESRLLTRQKDCFQDEQLPIRWRQAVQYHEAGVQLKKRVYSIYEKHSLLDIKFSNGVLEVPCLTIDENTESLFKNLIAFEQMDSQYENYITAYIAFMSQLVSTSEDATLLTERGIIVHMLDNDDEVSAMFTRLSTHLIFGSDTYHYLQTLSYVLEDHYQSRLNRWMAWLWRNHFSNPWLALGVLAAVVVLLCTIVQTIFTRKMVVKAAFAVAMFLLTTNMLVSVATRSPDNLLNSFPEETGHVYSASTVQKMTEYKPTTAQGPGFSSEEKIVMTGPNNFVWPTRPAPIADQFNHERYLNK
uniref:Uncharacterized protein n=1 Tax=Oryza rufipogon TaxID=4529 RepID=A0A0E0PEV6_ORYRU